MKKLLMLICASCMLLGLTACKEKKEEHKEFKQGDIVIEDGVIYTYYSYENLYESIIPFVEEDTPKSYYNYYYYDMSSYKEHPAIVPFEGKLFVNSYHPMIIKYNPEVFYNFLTYSNPIYSPQTAYFYRLIDYFSPEVLGEGFIVTGYTEDIKKDVEIPMEMENTPVIQIGFKAFENAPIETFTYLCYKKPYATFPVYNIIHPFAFSNCENLKTIKTDARVLSMGISNCPNLEEIYYITPTTDCSLYNLPKLKSIIDCHPFDIYLMNKHEYSYDVWLYSTYGGLRKSLFYNCPSLSEITGEDVFRRNNVIYISWSRNIPYYVFDNYTIMLQDFLFTDFSYEKLCCALYNQDNEIYLPYINNGLNYKGELFLDPESEDIKEEADAFYVTTAYPKIIEGASFYSKDEYNEPIVLKIPKK